MISILNNNDNNKNQILTRTLYQRPVKSDGGDYKCSVKNKWGTDFTTFQLG
jgi:hypothetical protein